MEKPDAHRRAPLKVGIVGAGVIGLASALSLVEAGHHVTVVADHLPGDFSFGWASPWYVRTSVNLLSVCRRSQRRVQCRAGALLAPHPEGDITIQKDSIRHWRTLLAKHPECGIRVGATLGARCDRSQPLGR